MLSEEEARGFKVWNTIGYDPNLLEGVTVGDLSDLLAALAKVLQTPAHFRDVPVGLVVRLSKLEDSSVAEQLENCRELLRVPSVHDALTRQAKEVF